MELEVKLCEVVVVIPHHFTQCFFFFSFLNKFKVFAKKCWYFANNLEF